MKRWRLMFFVFIAGVVMGCSIGLWRMSQVSQLSEQIEAAVNVHMPRYIGDVETKLFHKRSCPMAKELSKGRRVLFIDRSAALGSGFEPCGHCNP